MAEIKSINQFRTEKIIRTLIKFEKLSLDKIQALGSGDLNYYRTVSFETERKISRCMDELRKSRTIRGANAALHRLVYALERLTNENNKIFEGFLDKKDITLEEYKTRIKPFSDLVEREIKSFTTKTVKCLMKEIGMDSTASMFQKLASC
jgi:hypothetical protein